MKLLILLLLTQVEQFNQLRNCPQETLSPSLALSIGEYRYKILIGEDCNKK